MSTVKSAVAEREVTRICHFTPSRNLQHIAAGRVGVLSTASLEAQERGCFNATDLARFDQKKSHICCSVEFPNAWYFDKARKADQLFTDWVVLLIDPKYLWNLDTHFCARNAAANFGHHIMTGVDGFQSMYASRVSGAGGRVYVRSSTHLKPCPTDQQAEVLIADRIHLADVFGVAVMDKGQAQTERARLRTNGMDPDKFRFVIAPRMFDKYALSAAISSGQRPSETVYLPHQTGNN